VRLSSAAPVASSARREVADQPLPGALLVGLLADDLMPVLDGRSIEALFRTAVGVRPRTHLFLEHCALLI
jgi:hypothetical protein